MHRARDAGRPTVHSYTICQRMLQRQFATLRTIAVMPNYFHINCLGLTCHLHYTRSTITTATTIEIQIDANIKTAYACQTVYFLSVQKGLPPRRIQSYFQALHEWIQKLGLHHRQMLGIGYRVHHMLVNRAMATFIHSIAFILITSIRVLPKHRYCSRLEGWTAALVNLI